LAAVIVKDAVLDRNVAWRNRMAGGIAILTAKRFAHLAARLSSARRPVLRPLLLTRGGRMSLLTILIVVVLVLAAAWLVRHF
jgi:hypothetical protein